MSKSANDNLEILVSFQYVVSFNEITVRSVGKTLHAVKDVAKGIVSI